MQNPNCTLVVPPAPLSAFGLATPYELVATDRRKGQCHEASPAQAAFVEATILDPATGQLSIYRPLVIDRGTQPAVLPVVPTLPANAVVGIWFGFQGDVLTLAHAPGCVNGVFRSQFGQFAYCNAPAFFQAAQAAIQQGLLKVPPLGTAKDGQPCPTTRDFSVVDQDQSDNVVTRYVVFPNGQIAQDTGNPGALPNGSTFLNNGSDNGLLNNFIQPALGCMPFTAPDLTAGGRPSPSLALNELHAGLQGQPVALTPPNDPMTLVNNRKNFQKTNLYRLGVGQPLLGAGQPQPGTFPQLGTGQFFGFGFQSFFPQDTSREYCRQLITVATTRLSLDAPLEFGQPSPDIAMAPNLAVFLQVRLKNTLMNLGCPRGIPPAKGDG